MKGDMEMNGDKVISQNPSFISMRIARIISLIAIHPPISFHLHIHGLMKWISNS